MQEVDHTQRQRQVFGPHNVRCHHGDQSYVGAIKVTVEDGEGEEEPEGPKQWRKDAAQTFHRHREDVAGQAVRLQTPAHRGRPLGSVHGKLTTKEKICRSER